MTRMYLNYHKKEIKFCTFIIYGPRKAFKKDEKIVSNACSSHTNLFMHQKHPRKEFQIFCVRDATWNDLLIKMNQIITPLPFHFTSISS